MNCYFHEQRVAVTSCQRCGKALCKACIDEGGGLICASCAEEQINQAKQYMIKCIVLGVIMSIVFSVILQSPAGLMFGWVPFGWMALTSITPRLFVFLPIAGWVLYFAVKFMLSFLIGWIALPVKICQWIRVLCSK